MMVFHLEIEEVVVFRFWAIKSVAGMIASVVAISFISFCYEGLRAFRERLLLRTKGRLLRSTNERSLLTQRTNLKLSRWDKLVQTALQVVLLSLSYFLMLVVMTLNVWLSFAVLLGDAVGYYVFFDYRPANAVVSEGEDHCHI